MLYICPTPIGNLEDITLRVLRVLTEVDLILAEDTRRSGQLLQHFSISKPLESLHEHNEKDKAERIIALLQAGQEIALISDAGMPGISDPGSLLIQEVIKRDLPLQVLPGANAALVAYLQSGFSGTPFLFYGFLPRKQKERRSVLTSLEQLPYSLIFYEAPHRLAAMLEDLLAILGDRQVSISRELTKRFEETKRGTLSSLLRYYEENSPRGEFVVTVEGTEIKEAKLTEDDIRALLQRLVDSGISRKTAIAQVSMEYRLPKNLVYELALQLDH